MLCLWSLVHGILWARREEWPTSSPLVALARKLGDEALAEQHQERIEKAKTTAVRTPPPPRQVSDAHEAARALEVKLERKLDTLAKWKKNPTSKEQ